MAERSSTFKKWVLQSIVFLNTIAQESIDYNPIMGKYPFETGGKQSTIFSEVGSQVRQASVHINPATATTILAPLSMALQANCVAVK